VHESRVESRRLMAQFELLSAFVSARVQRARRVLKQHLDCFDTLRDTQVQLLLLRAAPLPAEPRRLLREALRQREDRCLRDAARDIQRVKVGRMKKVVTALRRRLQAAAGDADRQMRDRRAILRAVSAAHARVVERRRSMDAGHVATIHRTRVAFKKLRYMVEAMQPLFPRTTASRLKPMHDLQTLLGDLQDTDVFLAWLDKFLDKCTAHAASLAPFRHWLLARRATQIQRCMESADELQKFWPPPKPRPARRNAARRRRNKSE